MVLCALASSVPGAASAQVVRGRVIDAETGQPIRVAALELLDDREKVLVKTASDATGAFRLRGWLAAKYQVRASALGYQTVTSALLEVGTGEEFDLNIRLSAQAVPVEPVTVVARSRNSLRDIALRGYFDRRDAGKRIGIGRFLDRAEIEQRGTKLSDVIRKVGGLRVVYSRNCANVVYFVTSSNPAAGLRSSSTGGISRASSCAAPPSACIANVYLDGLQLQYDDRSMAQQIPLDWIEAIEVYRRPSELPAEFMQSGACGVIALWTRRG